jgi:hypothetical protein
VYKECNEDFEAILDKDKEGWFLNFYVQKDVQDEIVKKHLKSQRKLVKEYVNFNYYLGCAPMSVDFQYELKRLNDGLICRAPRIKWIEFDQSGRYSNSSPVISLGRSLLLSPFNMFFTWQTTPVTEIISTAGVIHFKTKNSEYKLTQILHKENGEN